MRADNKQEERDTVIYRGKGRESCLDVYELDELVLFCSPLFSSVTSIIIPAPVCRSIKVNTKRKVGEIINIVHKQPRHTDRVAAVTSKDD